MPSARQGPSRDQRVLFRAGSRGFSLTELMAVVAIMGVLATLAISALRQNAFASSVPEAQVVLRAIGVAEEQYRSLNQLYLNVTSTPPSDANGGFYPQVSIAGNKRGKFWNSSHVDFARWTQLAPVVQRPVEFVFKVHAGVPGNPLPAVAASAFSIPTRLANEPWYVAQARADADADGTPCVVVATSFMSEIRSANDGE